MSLSGYQYPGREITEYLAAIRLRVTPVPIPNTTVKTQAADGTALETVWQSRWPPELLNKCPGSRKAAHLENRIYEKNLQQDIERCRAAKDRKRHQRSYLNGNESKGSRERPADGPERRTRVHQRADHEVTL